MNLRSGVIPLEKEGEHGDESSKFVFEVNRRCFESTSLSDELKNFAKVEMVDMYDEKYTRCLKVGVTRDRCLSNETLESRPHVI